MALDNADMRAVAVVPDVPGYGKLTTVRATNELDCQVGPIRSSEKHDINMP